MSQNHACGLFIFRQELQIQPVIPAVAIALPIRSMSTGSREWCRPRTKARCCSCTKSMSECLYGAETRGDALSLVASAPSVSKSKMPWSPNCKIPMQRSTRTSVRGRDRPGPRQTAGRGQSQARPTPGRNQFSAATRRRCESSGAKVVPPCAVGAEHKSGTAEPPMARPAEVNGRGDLGQNTLLVEKKQSTTTCRQMNELR